MLKNIFVAIDLDKSDTSLIRKAGEFALKFKSKLWLVHVAAPDPSFVGFDAGPQVERDHRAKVLRKEHVQLQRMANALKKKKITAKALLIDGATVEMIIVESKKLKADLIVMGYPKHGWLHKLFGQDTSREVLKRSNVPVLLVPVK